MAQPQQKNNMAISMVRRYVIEYNFRGVVVVAVDDVVVAVIIIVVG